MALKKTLNKIKTVKSFKNLNNLEKTLAKTPKVTTKKAKVAKQAVLKNKLKTLYKF